MRFMRSRNLKWKNAEKVLVEPSGVEPLTFWLPAKRSTN